MWFLYNLVFGVSDFNPDPDSTNWKKTGYEHHEKTEKPKEKNLVCKNDNKNSNCFFAT